MVLRNLSTGFLMKCSVYVGIGTITTGMVMKTILTERIRKEEYFRTALKLTRQHEGAKALLGEPIKEATFGSFEYGRPNYADDERAYFEVKISGPKAKGTLFFWAAKEKEDVHWDVHRVEFQLGDDDTRRLKIKKSSEAQATAA